MLGDITIPSDFNKKRNRNKKKNVNKLHSYASVTELIYSQKNYLLFFIFYNGNKEN